MALFERTAILLVRSVQADASVVLYRAGGQRMVCEPTPDENNVVRA